MRFIFPIAWALVISGVISYVLASMGSEPFNLLHTLVLAIILCIAVFLLGEGILKESDE